MWDLPRPGIKPMSVAPPLTLAGRLPTPFTLHRSQMRRSSDYAHFTNEENWATERLSHLPKITQIESGRTRWRQRGKRIGQVWDGWVWKRGVGWEDNKNRDRDVPGGPVVRICLAMQGTLVQSLVWEDPTCHSATKPKHHNYWASTLEPRATNQNYWTPRACAPQREATTMTSPLSGTEESPCTATKTQHSRKRRCTCLEATQRLRHN